MRNPAPWTTEPDDQQIINAVRDLAPSVAELGDRIDTERRLPEELVLQLRAARVFEMYVPRTFGGPEVHPLTAFTVAEELARRDGSVGWCSQVAAAVTVFLAWIDPAGVEEMIRRSGSLHLAGSARPLGTAVVTEGGFRASGHWDYASGVRHANWYLGTCFVDRPDGRTTARSMLFPVSEGTIVGNWNVMGMRGTGSDDFVLQDVFVPDRRVASRRWIEQHPEPLYDPRLMMITAWAPTAGVGIGLAEGALDALLALGDRRSAGSPVPLREREAVQEAAGRAGAMAASARAFVVSAIGAAWDALAAGANPTELERAVSLAQLAITNTLNEAVRVADVAFHAAGTNAISVANRLERFLRDTHTAVQHSAGQPVHVRAAGRVLLGLDAGPVDPGRDAPTTPRP
ncbi:MAG: acyl-CoA dehydrogenase family protein [Acidimicrobiales bacterium]